LETAERPKSIVLSTAPAARPAVPRLSPAGGRVPAALLPPEESQYSAS